jgi:hypothetical protein
VARQRDYKAEYAARIARGEARGQTRSQARGHGADRKGAIGHSGQMTLNHVRAYVGQLKPGRSATVTATFESGRKMRIGQGKASSLKAWFDEKIADGGFDDLGPGGIDQVVSVQVIYTGG